ncbi:F-BAR and double SH3 domains protein 2 isoform X2 [Zootermopsis nevadensis]|uniref:F-BAR and double SH3 domains protein 2 isoform X2 n=1 Tax=Zootermopsis nevadensis TaxID=136037 RepID=UPI000B8E2267|nr:F-BAR and double SH3 domains protein 2 isoform X2 [Zootermopsis nevadensis]
MEQRFENNLRRPQDNEVLLGPNTAGYPRRIDCTQQSFTLKRSAIEKSYSEALLKISSAFLNRKIPNIPDIKVEGGEEKWNMWNVWRTVLEENEKLARARLAAVEVFHQQIADDAKVLKAHKLQTARKSVEHLVVIQKELQTCVQDIDKTKKLYFDEEHSAHDVRDKEEKLKKKKGSFLQSITSLQKNSAKVTSKREALEEKSTGARNDYLLSLAAANAHQTHYFVVDLQSTMQMMENNVYEKVAEYLMLIGRTELLTCSATQTSFTRIRDQAQQLTREYNLQCVYLFYPVLKQHIQYEFEPCDNDTVDKITADHASAVVSLSKEAKRWAARIARETNNVREYTRKLHIFQQLRDSGQKVDPNDQNGPDLETKIEELRQGIRRSETAKLKAEARIECLRSGGVNVDEWMQEVDNLSVQDMPRSASSLSVRTDASGTGEPPAADSLHDSDGDLTAVERQGSESEVAEDEKPEVDGEWAVVEQERQRLEQLTAGWDDPTQVDWGPDDGAPEGEVDVVQQPPTVDITIEPGQMYKCIALYNYTAQNPDELSIVENEQLEVVGEGDGDGWLRARNYRGEEGYVPHNYLDVDHDDQCAQVGGSSYQLVSQISFSSVDYTVDEPEDMKTQDEPAVEQDGLESYCLALYDYEATCPEELSFTEGQVIRVLRKVVHVVDDGWWEGELDGRTGLFPSLVVEECREDGEPLTPQDEDETPGSAPPVFTPPDVPTFLLGPQQVIVTQPTPIIDQPSPKPDAQPPDSSPSAEAGFEMQLSDGKYEQYDSQFQGSAPPAITVDECPTISIDDEEEEEVFTQDEAPVQPEIYAEGGKPESPPLQDDSFGLGVAQIVITAATPMVEEPEQPFPPPPSEEEVKASEQTEEVDQNSVEEPSLSEDVTVAEVAEEPDDPTDSAPFPISSSTGSEEDTYTGPSTAENSQSQPAEQPETSASSTAVGPESIPDELEPHQLAQLQDLKESNA